MKIEKTIEENHEARLMVEIETEKIEGYKRRAARKISERGKIPGFRPGKAPYHMVVLNYGEQAVMEQAIDFFVDAEYTNILKEAEVEPGAAGSLEAIDSLEPLKLTFRVPLAPEVDLGDYHSLRMPYEWSAPSQEEVDKALEDLRRMYAATENVEREAQEGDYVEARDFEWPWNGFAKELVGMKPGDTKIIQHTFPEDWDVEELQGRTVEVEVAVKTVRGTTLPELDDEFAKSTGIAGTLDELKEVVRADLESRSRAAYDDKYFVELIEKIKEGATFKYHQATLDHESEHVLEELSDRLAQQRMDLETYFKSHNTTREQFIAEEVAPVAKKRLERSLILDEIVRREELEVSDESLDAEFNLALNALAMQGLDVSKIRGGKKGQEQFAQAVAMESMSRVLTRNALELLKSIAIGEYKTPQERAAEAEAAKAAAEAASAEEKAEETETAVPVVLSESQDAGEPGDSSEEETKS